MSGADSPELWRETRRVPLARLKDSPRDALGEAHLRVLRAQVSFERVDELQESLGALSALLDATSPEVTLLQVSYHADTLSREARLAHEAFAARHPEVSTYFPLCLPPSPLGALIAATTPRDCAGCMFREGGRCDGLGGESRLDSSIDSRTDSPTGSRADSRADSRVDSRVELAGGALADTALADTTRDTTRDTTQESIARDIDIDVDITLTHTAIDELSPDPAHIANTTPLCYWWPEPHHLRAIAEALIAHEIRVLWDLGAGNGYLTELMTHLASRAGSPLDEAISVDPIASVYPARGGVRQWCGDATSALEAALEGQLKRPDALVISWPTPGKSYAEIIHALRPRLVLRMTDQVGVCGVRSGHYALSLDGHSASWFELCESLEVMSAVQHEGDRDELERWDDLTPPEGYVIREEHHVWSHRDLRARELRDVNPSGEREHSERSTNAYPTQRSGRPSGVLQITEHSERSERSKSRDRLAE